MSSLFVGKHGLRTQYFDMNETQINAATTLSAAHLIARLKNQCRITLINNGCNTDVALYIVHPELDGVVEANRLFWLEIPSQTPLNFDISGSVGLSLDVGTAIYVVRVGAAATNTSKLRIFAWG